jgi:Xaa-Pro aminopeptidase
MDLSTIQKALSEAGVDGWLFCDFHHRDQMAYKILGLDSDSLTSRRWFYFLPTEGQPVKLSHKVEPRKLDSLPGDQQLYLAYTELHEKLAAAVRGKKTIAMQYSPMNNIPYVSVVDAGTIELVRSFGVEIVSSADLVQQFDAVTGEDGYRSHCETGTKVHAIKDEAFKGMDDALRKGQQITEYDVREFILSRFEQEGLTADGSIPIVGFNDHPADPHFEPTKEIAHTLHHGDTILLDLWARRQDPPGVYYDITWCGFASTTAVRATVGRSTTPYAPSSRRPASASTSCTARATASESATSTATAPTWTTSRPRTNVCSSRARAFPSSPVSTWKAVWPCAPRSTSTSRLRGKWKSSARSRKISC